MVKVPIVFILSPFEVGSAGLIDVNDEIRDAAKLFEKGCFFNLFSP